MCDFVLLPFLLKHDDWNLEEDRKALQHLKVWGIFILFWKSSFCARIFEVYFIAKMLISWTDKAYFCSLWSFNQKIGIRLNTVRLVITDPRYSNLRTIKLLKDLFWYYFLVNQPDLVIWWLWFAVKYVPKLSWNLVYNLNESSLNWIN